MRDIKRERKKKKGEQTKNLVKKGRGCGEKSGVWGGADDSTERRNQRPLGGEKSKKV